MLGKWPFPNRLSAMPAWAKGLWIRRVLVRAQEGQSSPATTSVVPGFERVCAVRFQHARVARHRRGHTACASLEDTIPVHGVIALIDERTCKMHSRTAIVTGAGAGIGLETADALACLGASLASSGLLR